MGRRTAVGVVLLVVVGASCETEESGVSDGRQPDAAAIVPENTAAGCQDGIDNDGDGKTDCQDPDCWLLKSCVDASVKDAPRSDGVTPDAPPDGGQSDTSPADGPPPDTTPPDTTPPDTTTPDLGAPDSPVPDTMPPPDAPAPDTMPPDGGTGVLGTWVTIPPSGTVPVTFSMGSPTTEPCRGSDEDQHQVTLTHNYEIAAHEVTQGEFQAAVGYNNSYFKSCGSSCPVDRADWNEAAAYCNALSTKAGLAQCYSCSGSGMAVTCSEAASYSGVKVYDCPGYRLPTEAEWEHAYRAGTTTAFYNGANDSTKCTSCSDANADLIAWYKCNSGSTPHPVAQRAANSWGLYDMAGNVHEWCHDWYQSDLGTTAVTDPWGSASGPNRVTRGGTRGSYAYGLRAARRTNADPSTQNNAIGFRCARTITP